MKKTNFTSILDSWRKSKDRVGASFWSILVAALVIPFAGLQAQTPNCTDINVGIDADGAAVIEFSSFITNLSSIAAPTVTIENEFGGRVAATVANDMVTIPNACVYLDRTLKARVSTSAGSCWSSLTFKRPGGPIITGRFKQIYCNELEAVKDTLVNRTEPMVTAPCSGSFGTPSPQYITDWVVPFDCESDTAKIVYCKWEAFDKEGQRGEGYDTIIVYKAPEITLTNTYCAEKDTLYHGVNSMGGSEVGPYTLVPASPTLLMDCDTIYYARYDKETKSIEAIETFDDAKCGLFVHVDAKKLSSSCDELFKVKIEIKQLCSSALDCGGTVPTAPMNGLNMLADGYWECEFWVENIDTVPPLVECKIEGEYESTIWSDPNCDDMVTTKELVAVVPTTSHECAAYTYLPPVCVYDKHDKIKTVKATVPNIATVVYTKEDEECTFSEALLESETGKLKNPAEEKGDCYRGHDIVRLPYSDWPYPVIIEAFDSCHLVHVDTCWIQVKDLTKPVPVVDKGVTVSLSNKKVWVKAETFDEGSWDNCNINQILVRRTDWTEACVDLCYNVVDGEDCDHPENLEDATEWFWTDGHDTLYWLKLEDDKHCSEVEAYYAKMLDWFCNDGVPCGDLMYNSWLYDLVKYATVVCNENPHLDDHAFDVLFRRMLFSEPFGAFRDLMIGETYKYAYTGYYEINEDKVDNNIWDIIAEVDSDSDDEFKFKFMDPFDHTCFGDEPKMGLERLDFTGFKVDPGEGDLTLAQIQADGSSQETQFLNAFVEKVNHDVDQWREIGGGWAEEVVFDCDDVCEPVTVEVLILDYWCNWAKAWSTVWVEDKTPVRVVEDIEDVEISCRLYREHSPASLDGTAYKSIEEVAEAASGGDAAAEDVLTSIFGGYEKAWIDEHGNYVDADWKIIDNTKEIKDSVCALDTMIERIVVKNPHTNEKYWVEDTTIRYIYEDVDLKWNTGIVAVNCDAECNVTTWLDIDHCGEGYIYRKFEIWSGCGYTNDDDNISHLPDTIKRFQRIWVGNNCPLNKYMFDVPGDQDVYSCGIIYDDATGNVDFEAMGSDVGMAEYLFDDDCRIVGIGFEDKVFDVVGGDEACYKVIRTYYFMDWCTDGKPTELDWYRNEQYSSDIFSCEQKIIVYDTLAPQCVIEGEETVIAAGEECKVNYTFTVSAVEDPEECELQDAFEYEVKLGDAIAFQGLGSLADGGVTLEIDETGEYTIKVKVRDECNNEGICLDTFLITGKKPTPVCISSLTVELTPMDLDADGNIDTAMAAVWAKEFNSSSFDACGDVDEDDLLFFAQLLDDGEAPADMLDTTVANDTIFVGCEDIGTKQVQMWVLNPVSGTSDYCLVFLTTQNNMGGCDSSDVSLAGLIQTELNEAVEDVEVTASLTNGQVFSSFTSAGGAYAFATALGIDLTLTPSRNFDHDNGVTTLDLIMIQNHILGNQLLENSFRELAADVTNDDRISALDLVEIRRIILNPDDQFNSVESWRFLNNGVEGPLTISGLAPTTDLNWLAIKNGDVTQDAFTTGARNAGTLNFAVSDMEMSKGNTYSVEVKASDFENITGYQYTLNFDNEALELTNIEMGQLTDLAADNFSIAKADEGIITTSWFNVGGITLNDNDVVFTLEFKAKDDLTLSNAITANSRVTTAEAYDANGGAYNVALTFDGTLTADAGFALYQNQPNPVITTTNIGFNLPTATTATISILDLNGKTIRTIEGDYNAGFNQITLDRTDLGTSGVLYYQIDTEEFTATKKMIIVD